jgi:hypothetical protein
MGVMPITFMPGTEVPADGDYVAVDGEENHLERIITLRRGARFPACVAGETGYVLIELPARR